MSYLQIQLRTGLLFVGLLIVTLACNLNLTESQEPAPPPTQGQNQAETEPITEDGPVSNLEDVRRAVVQIEAQGNFIDPELGPQIGSAGRGSGFIIDPTGIAVTNNHVVTGAALLNVWVGGESEPRNARVLGVSECSDLAVIHIDGEQHTYLDWFEEPIEAGLNVYSAGFPLGDSEFTLTNGIVAKANAHGETNWASLDTVLEHDATINPGNSGGPLTDNMGRVVGVNYAASPEFSQYFAIPRDEAVEIVDMLRQNEDVESIGVNGIAVRSDDGSLSGVWVSSVASGSAADMAGVLPGDLITTMEGLPLGADGTMQNYCDILRTHGKDATLAIEVHRYPDGELMEGQLNGRALQPISSVADDLDIAIGGRPDSGGAGYSGWVEARDEFGFLTVEIPVEWHDVDGSPWVDSDGVIGTNLSASASLSDFKANWMEPGVFFGASAKLAGLAGHVQYLDYARQRTLQECDLIGRYDYERDLYRGNYDLFENCGGPGGSYFMVLTAVPDTDPADFVIFIEIQIIDEADLEAATHILESFDVKATPP